MNIYVGNLHYDVTEDDLKSLFEEYGQVDSAKMIMDKYSGKSKGFGFIEMSNSDEGQAAIDALDGTELKGRNLKVNLAREKSESDYKKPPRHKSYNR
ncbi:MAG: RNA-binding protein [Bacteroidales bacterium]|nr:RNA-binding protein [Bacteroidales bacterium]